MLNKYLVVGLILILSLVVGGYHYVLKAERLRAQYRLAEMHDVGYLAGKAATTKTVIKNIQRICQEGAILYRDPDGTLYRCAALSRSSR